MMHSPYINDTDSYAPSPQPRKRNMLVDLEVGLCMQYVVEENLWEDFGLEHHAPPPIQSLHVPNGALVAAYSGGNPQGRTFHNF